MSERSIIRAARQAVKQNLQPIRRRDTGSSSAALVFLREVSSIGHAMGRFSRRNSLGGVYR
jgi:hypothetical protein